MNKLQNITEEEILHILSLATDNGDFKGVAVQSLNVESRASNFVEGSFLYGKKNTYHYSIRYDATVEIRRMEFLESETVFVPGQLEPVYNFTAIVDYFRSISN
jgi:hypothetical protein